MVCGSGSQPEAGGSYLPWGEVFLVCSWGLQNISFLLYFPDLREKVNLRPLNGGFLKNWFVWYPIRSQWRKPHFHKKPRSGGWCSVLVTKGDTIGFPHVFFHSFIWEIGCTPSLCHRDWRPFLNFCHRRSTVFVQAPVSALMVLCTAHWPDTIVVPRKAYCPINCRRIATSCCSCGMVKHCSLP